MTVVVVVVVTDSLSTPEYQMMFIERQSIGWRRVEAVGGKVS